MLSYSDTPPPASYITRQRDELRNNLLLAGATLVASAGAAWAGLTFAQAPLWVVSAVGGVAATAVAASWPRVRASRRARVVWLGLAVGLGMGLVKAGMTAPRADAAADPNHVVAERVLRIDRELAVQRLRNPETGLFPANGEFIAAVNRMPNGAELLAGQPVPVGVAGHKALTSAAALEKGRLVPDLETPLGAGHAPGPGKAWDATTYGAVVYDYDARNGRYVLYGIGERDGQAVVVAVQQRNR